jgi:putative hydrolase of the HAD superfamily
MIDWQTIKTVLLDMDGTLLDLHFDNYFWLTHLPARLAEHRGQKIEELKPDFDKLIASEQGSLNWYCVDFWSETLGVDIKSLKEEVQHLIAFRPHVEHFLEALKHTDHRVILVTNAHRKSLDIKLALTHLDHHLDAIICSHDFGVPKEDISFWHKLNEVEPFDPESTVLIDDSLAVLDSARKYGIKHLLTILQPDSKQPERAAGNYKAIDSFHRIIPDKTK